MWISPTGPYPESLKWRVEVWPQCPPQTLWGSADARAGLQRLVEDLVVVPKRCFSCTVSGQVISLLSFYRIVMLFVIFSSFLVFFCHSLPICLLFIVIWSFLVLFWFAGFGSAAPPKTYFLATVESGFATFRSFDVIFCCFMPLLLSGLVGFRIIGNQIKRQKSHDEWQRPNEKEMTKTWHLFDNPQCVLARCSQQIVGQPHVYKWCQHQPTVCTHAAWQNQLPEYDKKHITKQTFRIDFPVFAGLSGSLAESNSLGILRIKLNQRT